jgi:RHS repeat-associated protein
MTTRQRYNNYVNGQGFCCTDKSSKMTALDSNIGNGNDDPEKLIFFYHSDHLGSTSYITNLDGEITQHIEYIPFGEVFIEERNNVWNTPYLFNSKELDEETGLYYYGARYYNPRESIFLSVDPLVEKTGTPYQYCYQNPVKFVDMFGMEGEDWIKNKSGKYLWDDKAVNQSTTRTGWEYVGKELPSGVNPKGQDILEEDKNGNLVHKNTDAWFNRKWNEWFGTDLAEKKLYDQAEENMLQTAIATAPIGFGIGKAVTVGEEEGVIYLRKDKTGNQKDYVGQAKSQERYIQRQKEHQRANPKADYDFKQIDNGKSGRNLDMKEQKHIDMRGGPTNKSNPNGGLQNKKNVIRK